MKRAIILKHVAFEGPARIATQLEALGCALDVRELHRGDAVPERLAADELLVVMGGPMGVGDLDRPELPFLRREHDLLARALAADAPVLGVCLGAQLMAAVAGAQVAPMARNGARVYEVGWAPVRFHHGERTRAALLGLPESAPMLHWHGDGFALPPGATRLASSEVWPEQAFQLGSRQFGLQFHCEVGAPEIETMLSADLDFAVRANGPEAAQIIRTDTARELAVCQQAGDRLLANLLGIMAS